MPLLSPIFTEVYRYYLKLKIITAAVIGIAQAGLEFEFDMTNPRGILEIGMTNPRGTSKFDMINPRAVTELDMTDSRGIWEIEMTNPRQFYELDMEELTT